MDGSVTPPALLRPTPGTGGAEQPSGISIFSLSDRLGRVRYLAYCLLGMLACCLILVVIYLLALLLPDALGRLVATGSFIIVKNVMVPMIVFIMSIRRLHDMGFNGWWSLCVLIPYATLLLLVFPGQRESNRFGPPPPPSSPLLGGLCALLLVALFAFNWYMIEINTGLVRPGAPGVAGAPAAKLPEYR